METSGWSRVEGATHRENNQTTYSYARDGGDSSGAFSDGLPGTRLALAFPSAKPLHSVSIESFELSKYEVIFEGVRCLHRCDGSRAGRRRRLGSWSASRDHCFVG